MRLSIHHVTRYDFSEPVHYGLQRLRLKPKSTHGQQVVEWHMDFAGTAFEVEYEDQHNNHVTLISLQPGTQHVSIECRGVVDTADQAGIIGQHSGHMPLWCFLRPTALTEPGPRLRALAGKLGGPEGDRLDQLHDLSSAVLDAVHYETGTTDVTTTAETALEAGHGVCQDHAHIFIAAGRLLDIPMRYVSGYLKIDGRVEQEAGHGWAEAYVQGVGWVGFDISNGISPDERYVRVATGCDYSEAAPVIGMSLGGSRSKLAVQLAVDQQQSDQ